MLLAMGFLAGQEMIGYLRVLSLLVGVFAMAVETVAEVCVLTVVPRQPSVI